MAGNSWWAYLPDSGEYINLVHIQRVLTVTSERVLVDLPGEDEYLAYTGEDAEVLLSALRKLVDDGK